MKVVVIGASGGTGTEIVRKLLKQKHKVVAFVRDPKNLKIKDKNLSIVTGNVRDLDALKFATKNVDAVISALGTNNLKKTTLHTDFARNIVSALEANGVSRLITISAWGVGESRAQSKLVMRVLSAIFLRHVFADIARAEKTIRKSDLDYTFVRPGRLIDANARRTVKVSTAKKPHVSISIARADVAGFAVDQVDSTNYSKQAPIIGY
jgi:putative NADH-flavin reductase